MIFYQWQMKNLSSGVLFFNGCQLKLGRGSLLFWKALWCGEKYLQESFPRLYSTSNKKSAKVGDVVGVVICGI